MSLNIPPQLLMALMGTDTAANIGAVQSTPAAALAGQWGQTPFGQSPAGGQPPMNLPGSPMAGIQNPAMMLPGSPMAGVPQPQGGMNLGDLMGNPMFGAAMGLLAASRDKNINPYSSAFQGMQATAAMKNRSDMMDMYKAEIEDKKFEREQARKDAESKAKRNAAVAESLKKSLIARAKADDGKVDADEWAEIDARMGIATAQLEGGGNISSLMNLLGPEGVGPFEGQGMEAQALNAYLANIDNPEWLASHEGRLVQQRLTRGIATPMGMMPGYDLGEASGGGPTISIPRPAPEGQRKAGYAAGSMLTAEQSVQDILGNAGFDPTAAGNLWAKTPFFGNYLASEEYQQYQAGADEWTTNVVFLRSGATAREEEKTSAFRNYWPQPGDGKGTVLYKQMLRDQQMVNAYQQGMTNPESPAFQSPMQQQELAQLQQKAALSEAMYKRYTASGGEADNSGWSDEDERRLQELEAKKNATDGR